LRSVIITLTGEEDGDSVWWCINL